jgi:DNA-directed RNA polymerase specialized sigma24 family protein
LFGAARRVYAQHCAEVADGGEAAARDAGSRVLDDDEFEELGAKIDAQRAGRELIEPWARLPAIERDAIELVDLAGLTPKEAALAMSVSPGAMRVRLFRARARLRKEHNPDG